MKIKEQIGNIQYEMEKLQTSLSLTELAVQILNKKLHVEHTISECPSCLGDSCFTLRVQ